MSDELTPGDEVPWILKHAAARRGDVAETIGHVDEAPVEEEAPVSKFRRVSGATAAPAAAPVRAATRPYTPPAPPAARVMAVASSFANASPVRKSAVRWVMIPRSTL